MAFRRVNPVKYLTWFSIFRTAPNNKKPKNLANILSSTTSINISLNADIQPIASNNFVNNKLNTALNAISVSVSLKVKKNNSIKNLDNF